MLNQILAIVEPAVISILGAIISYLGVIAVSYIKSKKDAVVAKIGQDEYDHEVKVAGDVFKFVDEEFRVKGIVGKAIEDKIASFNTELLKRIPNLTQTQLDSLRQTVAGQINAGKDVIVNTVVVPVVDKPVEVVEQPVAQAEVVAQ